MGKIALRAQGLNTKEKSVIILLLLLLIQQGSEIRVGVYIVLRTKYNLYLQKFLVISL